MPKRVLVPKRVLAVLAALALTAAPGPARAEPLYAQDLRKERPAAYEALRRIVPPRMRKVPWIHGLQGVAWPLRTVEVDGRTFLIGGLCQPHDCQDNMFVFLVAPDGAAAAGLVRSSNVTGGRVEALGRPSGAQRRLLRRELGPDG